MISDYDAWLSARFVTPTKRVIQPLYPWITVLRSPRCVACAFQIGPEIWLVIHAAQHEIQHNRQAQHMWEQGSEAAHAEGCHS